MNPSKRFNDFVALVRDVRNIQRYYRRTLGPITRREMERIEDQLDREIETVAAELRAGDDVQPDAIAAEGGAP